LGEPHAQLLGRGALQVGQHQVHVDRRGGLALVDRQPTGGVFLLTSGEAVVQKPRRHFRSQNRPGMEVEALEGAVRGASEDLRRHLAQQWHVGADCPRQVFGDLAAAALEPRFACCVAWGAQWDYHAIWAKRLDDLASGKVLSLSVPPEHLQWVLGVSSQAAALKKLEAFRLDGIVQKMRCPFLLLHGAGDEQIPLSLAEKCFAAVGSKEKTFKVFEREEGGFHHCQVDNVTIAVHYMWDWIEDVLKPRA